MTVAKATFRGVTVAVKDHAEEFSLTFHKMWLIVMDEAKTVV